MLRSRLRFLAAFSTLSLAIAGAQSAYRDPQGRFTVPVPPGWKASAAGELTMLTSGSAYVLVRILEGGAEDPGRVSQFRSGFIKQWSNYREMGAGPADLGGSKGAFTIVMGTNPKGAEAVVRFVSAPVGNAAYQLVSTAPLEEWQSKKAGFEAIERGFTTGMPAVSGPVQRPPQTQPQAPVNPLPKAPVQTPVQPPVQTPLQQPPRPQAQRGVPSGFNVVAKNGETGRALTTTFTGGKSAKSAFSGLFKHASTMFDSSPTLQAAVGDAQDQEVQGFFRAVSQGARVRGWMIVSIDGGNGYAGIIFDREDLFPRSYSALGRQMSGALPKSQQQASAPAAPRQPVQLTNTQLLDGSGWIGLAPGWKITGSYKGVVDAVGPNEQGLSLGFFQAVQVQLYPGTQIDALSGPICDPPTAFFRSMDILLKRPFSKRTGSFRYLEQAQAQPAVQRGRSMYLSYEMTVQGKSYRGLALVTVAPIDNTQWFYYSSYVNAPSSQWAEAFPVMWQMWKSWSLNPALIKERMDATLQSMKDTYRLIQEAHDYKMRAYSNANTGWSQVIRGVTTIEDVVTRERGDVDTNHVDDVLRVLNRNGYQYRAVPLPELTR